MSEPIADVLPAEMLDRLPPELFGADCPDVDFESCGHGLHGTRSPEANIVMSANFAAFLRAEYPESAA